LVGIIVVMKTKQSFQNIKTQLLQYSKQKNYITFLNFLTDEINIVYYVYTYMINSVEWRQSIKPDGLCVLRAYHIAISEESQDILRTPEAYSKLDFKMDEVKKRNEFISTIANMQYQIKIMVKKNLFQLRAPNGVVQKMWNQGQKRKLIKSRKLLIISFKQVLSSR
jgi:hypothetical protein